MAPKKTEKKANDSTKGEKGKGEKKEGKVGALRAVTCSTELS
jgi:hypothetical protein